VATRVLLVRHAQSTWNAEGRWQGWADPPLSMPGELAARAAAADPVLDPIDAVVSSDLQRAADTAGLLAGDRPWPAVQRFRGLHERGAGAWTGLTRQQIDERWPGALTPNVADIPGGESSAAVTARAVATLHRIAAGWPDAAVLAVSHGALIRLVEHHAGGEPAPVVNLGGRWVMVEDGRITLGDPVRLAPVAAVGSGSGPLSEPDARPGTPPTQPL
jgi:broad specificity phosphatase PhoE